LASREALRKAAGNFEELSVTPGRPNEFVVGLNEAYYRARITGDETPGLSLIKLGTEKSTKVVL